MHALLLAQLRYTEQSELQMLAARTRWLSLQLFGRNSKQQPHQMHKGI
jgi:hypothetical protein